MARYRKKDWISLLKKNRNLETHSFVLKDAGGKVVYPNPADNSISAKTG